MINLLPEPKMLLETGGFTKKFNKLLCKADQCSNPDELLKTARLRFWNDSTLDITCSDECIEGFELDLIPSLDGICVENNELFISQGYYLEISSNAIALKFRSDAGFINGITSIKQLIKKEDGGFCLPLCKITDYPSVPVRAVAPTFSWYAGYGRIGFDSQLWGFEEWAQFLNICADNKINQLNMVMYGYWPFELPDYPETTFCNVPIKIWNAENSRWLTVRFSHPNLEEPFLGRLIAYAHRLEIKIFAYVGLNSYNGGYSIKHPEARGQAPKSDQFLNDFDSLCLSYPGTVDYILKSMRAIASLGFDGFTLEESEEGFWFCECDACRERWHKQSALPVEAKHKANIWLLNQIYDAIREINPQAVIGI
ncbi:MAG: glycoside hydrolase family 20 zincin-like fold domain-containing protein, partial [Eubacteriales bacterium]